MKPWLLRSAGVLLLVELAVVTGPLGPFGDAVAH